MTGKLMTIPVTMIATVMVATGPAMTLDIIERSSESYRDRPKKKPKSYMIRGGYKKVNGQWVKV